jgi:hypothetical protein
MARPSKKKAGVTYEIEGYFPVGHVAALMRTDPSKWTRGWKLWHSTPILLEARNTLRAGNYLCHRTCPISYSMLRIVRVTEKERKVIK